MRFADALKIPCGITAVIGSGGKTSLILRLAQELCKQGKVIITTSTLIYPTAEFPVVEHIAAFDGCVCVGTPCENGKLKAPQQSFEELSALADFVLVEADGAKHLPLKAHLPHEPVIPNDSHVVCVVGASGLNRPIAEAVHRWERFYELTQTHTATPQAVAAALEAEGFAHRYLINQADYHEPAARELAKLLTKPVSVGSVQKGELLCSY